MRKNKLKILVPSLLIITILIVYIFSLYFKTVKIIEIDVNGQIQIGLNHFNNVTKLKPINTNGQAILDNLSTESNLPIDIVSSILDTAISNNFLKEDSTIKVLFSSNNLVKDIALIRDISTELELTSIEKGLSNNINQYKLTLKDYKKINKDNKNKNITTFLTLENGFFSKSKKIYITSIINKSDSYFITFSNDVVFTGTEKITSSNGNNFYETTPAGYNRNTLAVFVNDVPENISLKFDVSITDYPELFGYCITPRTNETGNNVSVTFSIDNDINKVKLNELKQNIDAIDIPQEEKYDLLNQYEILFNSVDKISNSEQLNDFNIMYENILNSIETIKNDLIAQSSDTTNKNETALPEKQEETLSFTDLYNQKYNELNHYKAIVLSIQNTDTKNALNAQINNLYYELSICKNQEDFNNYEILRASFIENISPYTN